MVKKLLPIPEYALQPKGFSMYIERKDKWRNRICFCGSRIKFKFCCYTITKDAPLTLSYSKSIFGVVLAKILNWLKMSNFKKGK